MTSPPVVTCAKRLAPSLSHITTLIATLLNPALPPSSRHTASAKLCNLLDDYLPEPTLLDSVLPTLVTTLTPTITLSTLETLADPSTTSPQKQLLLLPFHVLQTAHKVRGAKLVVRHYPHTVASFAHSSHLALFAVAHLSAPSFWRVRATLFYWLANVALMPFPLTSLTLPETITALARAAHDALASASPSAAAAALFLARLATRADAPHLLADAVTKCAAAARGASAPARHGALRALAAIFKAGRRDVLAAHTDVVMAVAAHVADSDDTSTIDAHLAVKLAQRVALAHLPPRVCAWRYARGRRLLFGISPDAGARAEDTAPDADSVIALLPDAQEDVEQALGVVLAALEHRDAVVRWSGAKGVGRIAARLDMVMAGEVVSHVLDTFDTAGDEASWNGGCLALAELLRRGLVLPHTEAFDRMLRAVEQAARFDVRRGAHSVGEHVRDAACYVVWAVARAYEADDVRGYATRIAQAMLRVALFDRELHCRRAAAAALQECVGRLPNGVVVEGIYLVTVADFFALSDRVKAYLDIATGIAAVADGVYFECVVDELAGAKLTHWDVAIRLLAAKALRRQIANDQNGHILKQVVPRLIHLALEKGDVLHRHGAVAGLAEVLKEHGKAMGEEQVVKLLEIPAALKRDNCYQGRSAEIVQTAVCTLTEVLASSVPHAYTKSEERREHARITLTFLDGCLAAGKEEIRAAAVCAYDAMCRHVFAHDSDWTGELSRTVSQGLRNGKPVQRQRGFALAAGCFVDGMLIDEVVDALLYAVDASGDAEVRRNAVQSLGRISGLLTSTCVREVCGALTVSMADYAVDDRGDVGSWVREAAMEAAVAVARKHELSDNIVLRILACIVRQSVERIDRTRIKAGKALYRLSSLCTGSAGPNVTTSISAVSSAFDFDTLPAEEEGAMLLLQDRFSETESIFNSGAKLLQDTGVRSGALRGLVASAGGMGHQSAHAMSALILHAAKSSEMTTLSTDISELFIANDDRLVSPALCVTERLAQEGLLHDVSSDTCVQIATRARKSWSGRLTDVKRTAAAIGLLAELACVKTCMVQDTVARKCIEALVVVLAGVVPRLRRITAEWLYLVLVEIEHEHTQPEAVRPAMDRLCDTPWEQLKTMQARQVRNTLCELLGVDRPMPKKKAVP